MGIPHKRRATYDDLLELPENVVGEIVNGELFVSPRPAMRHAVVESAVLGDLHGPFGRGRGGPGGWWIVAEPELHFGDDVLVPDLAGWRRERMPAIPDLPAIELPPDWICEVISPRTARVDRTRKMPVYARVGIPHMSLVDPIMKTLEVYRLGENGWLLASAHSDDDKVRIEPFAAVELELKSWWIDGTGAGAGEE